MLELNNIYCGDNIALMQQLDRNCIDLTVSSPPYGALRKYKGISWDFEGVANELYRITKEGGVVVWIVGDQTENGTESLDSFKQAIYFKEQCGFLVHDTMLYAKNNYVPLTHRRYEQSYDYAFVLSKGVPKTFNPLMIPCKYAGKKKKFNYICGNSTESKSSIRTGKFRKEVDNFSVNKDMKQRPNIWYYSVGANQSTCDKIAFMHPAVFHEKLAEDHVLSWSNEGDVIFDPFLGSGTVTKIAKKLKRQFLGFDISEEYCEIARERLKIAEEEMKQLKQTEIF